MNRTRLAILATLTFALTAPAMAATQAKPASKHTKKENAAVLEARSNLVTVHGKKSAGRTKHASNHRNFHNDFFSGVRRKRLCRAA